MFAAIAAIDVYMNLTAGRQHLWACFMLPRCVLYSCAGSASGIGRKIEISSVATVVAHEKTKFLIKL